jgi:hypothetical protein
VSSAPRAPIYVAFDRLPGVVRTRLVRSLSLEGPPFPVRQRIDDSMVHFVVLVPIALGLAMMAWRLASARWWYPETSAMFWTTATALVLVPAAALYATLRRRRALPFAQGKYVLPTDLVVTSGAELEIHDLRDLVLNNVRWLGAGTWTASEEKARTVELVSADDPMLFMLDASLDVDAVRDLAQAKNAAERGDVEPDADAFRELRGEDRRILLSRLDGAGDGPRATAIPALVRYGWALGIVLALAAGGLVLALAPPMPTYDTPRAAPP